MDADAGALLTGVRREAGLTQAELARRAGTSQAMVARYETGAASPAVALLREHRAEIKAAAEAVGARNVRVFGSVARRRRHSRVRY